jgi:4'-phosphopantetheinyl transferase EntD
MTLRKLLTSSSCTELLSCVEDTDNDVLSQTSLEDNAKYIDYAENETFAFVLDEFEENANTVLQIFRANPSMKKEFYPIMETFLFFCDFEIIVYSNNCGD